LGIIIPTDYIIFFRGVETTNQLVDSLIVVRQLASCDAMYGSVDETQTSFRKALAKTRNDKMMR
jgi:hypothetical protein